MPLLLLLSACGQDKKEAPDVAPDRAEAEAGARASVLKAGDAPPGWTAKPAGEQLDQEATWSDLLGCLGLGEAGKRQVATAASSTFAQGVATQAASTVSFVSDRRSEQVTAALAGKKANECVGKAFSAQLRRSGPPSAKVGPVKVAPFVIPSVEFPLVSFRGQSTVDTGAVQVLMFVDLVVLINGNSISRLMFMSTGGPVLQETQISLVNKQLKRT